MAEVPVAGNERSGLIETALRDQGVGHAGFLLLLRTDASGTPARSPKPGSRSRMGQPGSSVHGPGQRRIARKIRRNRRQYELLMVEGRWTCRCRPRVPSGTPRSSSRPQRHPRSSRRREVHRESHRPAQLRTRRNVSPRRQPSLPRLRMPCRRFLRSGVLGTCTVILRSSRTNTSIDTGLLWLWHACPMHG